MKVKTKTLVLCICLSSLSMPACARTPSPIPIGANTMYYGNIVEGSKFGVDIEDLEVDANAALLADGFRFQGEIDCQNTVKKLVNCMEWSKIDHYTIQKPFVRGSVVLRIEDGRVKSVVWAMYALPNTDF